MRIQIRKLQATEKTLSFPTDAKAVGSSGSASGQPLAPPGMEYRFRFKVKGFASRQEKAQAVLDFVNFLKQDFAMHNPRLAHNIIVEQDLVIINSGKPVENYQMLIYTAASRASWMICFVANQAWKIEQLLLIVQDQFAMVMACSNSTKMMFW